MKHDFNISAEAFESEMAARADISLRCEVRQGTRAWKLIRLEDLSQAGFRIAWLPDASVGQALKIRIPGLEPLSADVRWVRGKAVGCQFSAPLHVAVFKHVLREASIQAG